MNNNKHIGKKEFFGFSIWQLASLMLIILTAVCPILHFTHYYEVRKLIRYILFPASVFMCAFAIIKRNMLKSLTSKLLVTIPIWICISFIICCYFRKDLSVLGYTSPTEEVYRVGVRNEDVYLYYSASAGSILICFVEAFLLDRENRKKGLDIILWAAVIIITIYSGSCILKSIKDPSMMILEGRLNGLSNPNNLGAVSLSGFVFCLYLMFGRKKWYWRLLLLFMGIVLLAAIILTDSRTSLLAALPAVFMFGYFQIKGIFSQKQLQRKTVQVFLGILTGVVLCAVPSVIRNPIKSSLNIAIASSHTDETLPLFSSERRSTVDLMTEEVTVKDNMSKGNTISSRRAHWESCLIRFKQHPENTIYGCSPIFKEYYYHTTDTGFKFYHVHNGFLGILLSYGLVGFALFAIFLLLLLVDSLWVITDSKMPLEVRFLPVLLIPPLLTNMMEEMLFTREDIQAPTVMLMLIAGFVVLYSEESKARKKKERI